MESGEEGNTNEHLEFKKENDELFQKPWVGGKQSKIIGNVG